MGSDVAENLQQRVGGAERIDGIIDNIRYRSLTREGRILSLSIWRDEKALIRWRTHGCAITMSSSGSMAH
jgi:heme-degrading monooxygenase HmoA